MRLAEVIVFGLCAGAITSAGVFSLISSIGLINRYADVTDTKNHIILYEECLIVGAALGNVIFIFGISIPVGVIGCAVYGLISGMFIGTFLVCLAETIKGLPIFIRRSNISYGIGYVVLSLAIGKAVGQLAYYLYLY